MPVKFVRSAFRMMLGDVTCVPECVWSVSGCAHTINGTTTNDWLGEKGLRRDQVTIGVRVPRLPSDLSLREIDQSVEANEILTIVSRLCRENRE